MAKRFTDSDKWKKPWFRRLTPLQKCFWIYLLDNCDQAGFWSVDFDLAEIFIGESLSEVELRGVFQKQYEELADGKKWFIRDFISFQYGELKETNRLHVFVQKIIEKQGVSTPLTQLAYGAKDKVKDKEIKGIVKGKPTVEEVKALFREKGFPAEAEKFFDYYEANGWRVGKNPMKSWTAAAANWLRNGKSFGNLQTAVKKEKKPRQDCEGCRGSGKLSDGRKCWCW